MYGDFLLLDSDDGARPAERLAFGDTAGRNEAWLRDTLIEHPQLLPVADIDPSFGPLVPLCTELGTLAGPIDAVFISPHGRLTLVECKLWRNPEARRKVVAQILDYARVLARWSYADLQRQVAARTRRTDNVAFELCRRVQPDLNEQRFVDQVSRALREGRFLLLIAGDGIREDVGAIAELINRNSAMGFSFGLIEVALYGLPGGGLLMQPRVVARTKLIERTVIVVRDANQAVVDAQDDDVPAELAVLGAQAQGGEGERQAAYRCWWQPVLDAKLDDPDQDAPKLYWPNHVRAQLPMKGTWVTGYVTGGVVGVFTAGRARYYDEFVRFAEANKDDILKELPEGSQYTAGTGGKSMTFLCERAMATFSNETAAKAWIAATLNEFLNVLRPRLKEQSQNDQL